MRQLLLVATALALLGGCKASFKADQPLGYPCSRDGGASDAGGVRGDAGADPQCPGGWVCGLEGRCHSPDAGADYLCEADTDCTGGWRCGLEKRCHPIGVASDYLCQGDPDCEDDWRCGPEGRCVGFTEEEALRPGPGPLPMSQPFPWPYKGLPDRFSASYPMNTDGGADPVFQVYGRIEGQNLLAGAQTNSPGSPIFQGGVSPDPKPLGAVGTTARALGSIGLNLLVLHGSGLTVFPSAGAPQSFPINAGNLRVARGLPPMAVAYSGSRYSVLWATTVSGGVSADPSPRTFVGLDGAPRDVLDIADLDLDQGRGPPGSSRCPASLIAAAGEVLGVAPRNVDGGFVISGPGGPWVLRNAANLLGIKDASFTARELRTRGQNLLAISGDLAPVSGGNGVRVVVLADVGLSDPDGGLAGRDGGLPAGCMGGVYAELRLGPYPLCAPDEELIDFQPVAGGQQAQLVERCRSRDRERTVMLTVPMGAPPERVETRVVVDDSSLFADTALVSRVASGAPAYAGSHGQIWLGSLDWPPVPLVPDRPPLFVGTQVTAAGNFTVLACSTGGWQLGQPDGGYPMFARYRPGDPQLLAGVEGRPTWAVMAGGLVVDTSGPRWVAYPQAATAELSPPFLAVAVATSDGGTELVLASGDAVYGADVSAADAGGSSELDWRLVPSPGASIRSLALFAPPAGTDGGVPLFQGYVLAQDRLLALTAVTERHWQAVELPLPSDGEPAKLWADGTRGRLAFVDGRVMSLPSRVFVAPALPDQEATDFAQVCGQGYALSASGLYRLDAAPDGGPVGRWTSVDLTGSFSGGLDGGDFGFANGRLFSLDNDLFVFSRYGNAVKLDGPPVCKK